MRITYSVPATEKNKVFLCATIQRLFRVEPTVVHRVVEPDADLAKGDWWIHMRSLQVVQTPYVVFTLSGSGMLSPAQRAFVSCPDVEVERHYGPGETLYECIRDKTYA